MRTIPLGVSFALLTLVGCSSGSGSGGTTTPPPPPPVAASPTFAPTPGLFTTGQSVTLADTTTGATIHYTIDGSTPTTTSTTYTAPIPFTADVTITAIAVATDYTTSPTTQGLYQIAGPTVSVVQSTHDQTQLMAAQAATLFTDTTAGTNNVIVDEAQTYQTIEGFGAAFTDSAAPLLEQVIAADPSNYLAHFRLSTVYRKLHRPDDVKRELDAYTRYKDMHEKLTSIYKTLDSPDKTPGK